MKDDISRLSSGYEEILTRINDRAADAVLGKGRIQSASLRATIARRLRAGLGSPDAFVADPVFEAARIWKRADRSLDALAGTMLEDDLVAALDKEGPRRWPRSGKETEPYAHQLKAWEVAADDRSFMVTSGTGSGKTECFMIPMLNDLLRQAPGRRRQGVQAIVLYPLNALIDSQKERLSAWIDPLSDRLTYSLYNRYLPDSLPAARQRNGAEIRDRKTLRADPASVLVTNVTMLEYMLMRAQDRPILEKSQGTLRWIILDEAHSYVGAQAAEMALLLRRVRNAFGVAPEDVRLAATSATIGEGPETREALAAFLADLAGLSPSQVVIIEGEEVEAVLPKVQSDAAIDLESHGHIGGDLWSTLAPNGRIQRIRSKMRDGGVSLRRCSEELGFDPSLPGTSRRTLKVLEAAAQAQDPATGIALAPWRLHVFHRAQGGIWACVDPDCSACSTELKEEGSDWPFGEVYLREREKCSCGGPVFEIGACDECGTPWLLADVQHLGPQDYLRPASASKSDDEYILDVEPDENADEPENTQYSVRERVMIGRTKEVSREYLRVQDGALFEQPSREDRVVPVRLVEEAERDCCGKAHQKGVTARPQRFGAPFLMGNAMPLLLEAAKPNPSSSPVPSGGRRLLSFTDSRQGTARFSAKLQQEAERTLTRACIYHSVQKSESDPEKAAKLLSTIEALRPVAQQNPALKVMLAEKEKELLEAEGASKPMRWEDMVKQLAANPELQNFARPVWRDRPQKGENSLAEHSSALAELFLYREFFRRPRLQNNAETMGIARLVFQGLNEQARLKVPEALREAGHGTDVWADLLHAVVDNVFRTNLATKLPEEPADVRHWIAPKSVISVVLEPGLATDTPTTVKKPTPFPGALSNSNLVGILYRLTGGSRDSAADVERVATLLSALWTALIQGRVLWSAGPGAWRLDLTKSSIAKLDHAFECPVTKRLLPFAPGGISLNVPSTPESARLITMPTLPIAAPNGPTQAERRSLRAWLENDAINEMRLAGHWSDIHDRIAEFSPFLRAQEHSAQIDRMSLAIYEEAFRKGEINVLNCSTTMEMGVDIPDVGLVVNTNVPPAPANYRQRIGRAGRRGEPWAMAFTFCKDLPLDRMIFDDPSRLLRAEVQAPRVRLDSAVLVQRHVNALLLGLFLRGAGGLNVKTSIGTFFGALEDPDNPFQPGNVAEDFLIALKGDWAETDAVREALRVLVRGTGIEGRDGLVARCEEAFSAMRNRWRAEYEQLLAAQAAYPEVEAAHRLYRYRAKRMREEFMMTELARRGFTPSYGFPVDVVSFDHAGSDSAETGPSRPMDMAIREFSPGCEVVIDGLVHRSDGILPTWGNRHDPSSIEDLRTLFTCRTCGAFGFTRHDIDECPRCQSMIKREELLRPSGFLGTRKPHSAYEQLAFVPPDPARVSAEPEEWVSMLDPEVGRYRTARAGRVLVTASGEGQAGYAICIACGRAESETSRDEIRLPSGLKDHYPLQRLRDNLRHDGRCPGNEEVSRKIRRHVRLGTEMTTDVFELQLDVLPWTSSGKQQALAIAAGLREALASRLGVDAETMGIAVSPSIRADNSRRSSIFLYDKASGGSGFAAAADQNLPALLTAAAERLECRAACANGCPECVLRRDLQFNAEALARAEGLHTLKHDVLPRLALPEPLKIFGDDTGAITRSFAEWCYREAASGRLERLTLFLSGSPSSWDIVEWPGLRALAETQKAGGKPAVVVRQSDIASLEMSQKLDLVRLAARTSAQLHAVQEVPEIGGCRVIAEATIDGVDMAIAASDGRSATIDRDWGTAAYGPLLRGVRSATALSNPLSLEKLTAFGEGNSAHRDITTELDGPINRFGASFWKVVRSLRPQAFAEKKVVNASYNDRYLRNPLTARLLFEVWRQLPNKTDGAKLEVVSEQTGLEGRPGYLLHHNWETDQLRSAALKQLLPGSRIRLVSKSSCAHARFLNLHFDDGSNTTVFLDQGFGAWRSASDHSLRFAHTNSAEQQAKELERLQFKVNLQDEGRIPSPIWVKW